MAATVDERIVAAKFDSSDFEKGVDKTIKKLDELKKSLNVKDAADSMKELAEKTEKSTNSVSQSLEKLTDRFTNFTGMIKQKILSGLADEVAGVFMKMEQSVKNFITGISSQQVGVGMQKYEQMLTSVRIMMSAGDSEDSAYDAIGRLRDYSDQTSYSLSQMTDALSKLRASGVDLDTATKSVEGIANACANAGINANDAQRAFYNLSQAYSSGTLKYTDYRSLELLNMTTEKFKEQLLDAAVQAKTLKKVSEGVYQTINTGNKKVTAGKKVTKQNLQDMLRYNFVTSDVMNELFGGKFFFDEDKFKEYKKKYASLDEAIAAAKKDYGETAVEAYLAAREARNFTDVINTLKDVVSTGWSTTFEHLFGKLESATKFFTELAEGPLADVIYKIGEYRNAVLGYWNTLDAEGNASGSKVLKDAILNIADALGTLFRTFQQILPGFDELNYEEGRAQPQLENVGRQLFRFTLRLKEATQHIKEAAEAFNKWMNSPMFEGGPTRIEMIRKTIGNLASVLGIASKLFGIAFRAIGRIIEVTAPIFDGFITLLEKVTEPLADLNKNEQPFKDIEYSIENIMTVIEPFAKILGNVVGFLGEIGKFLAQMAIDTVISNISFFTDVLDIFLELLTGHSAKELDDSIISPLQSIKKAFVDIKDACKKGLDAIKGFFGALIEDVRTLLGLPAKVEGDATKDGKKKGLFANIIEFFETNQFIKDAKAWIDNAITEVGNFIKSIPNRVKQFGANVYDTIYGLLFTDETEQTGTGKDAKVTKVKTDLGKWLDQVIFDIKEFIFSIPSRIIEGVGKLFNLIDAVFNAFFGITTDEDKAKNKDSNTKDKAEKDVEDKVMSRFDEFIDNIVAKIIEWSKELPSKIESAFTGIGDFVSNLYNMLDEFLFGKKRTEIVQEGKGRPKLVTTRYLSGFSLFLDKMIREINKFIDNIPTYIQSGIKGIGSLANIIVNSLFGITDEQKNAAATGKEIENKINMPFDNLNLDHVLSTIEGLGNEVLNQVLRLFTGTDDLDFNMEWFANKIAEGIGWIKTKAQEAFTAVQEWFINLPNTIAGFFKGENPEGGGESGGEEGPVGKAIREFAETIGGFILSLPETIAKFLISTFEELTNLWDLLYNTITTDSEDAGTKAAEAVSDAATPKSTGLDSNTESTIKSKWESFVESIGQLISSVFENLPVMLAQALEIGIINLDKTIGDIGKWFANMGNKDTTKDVKEGAQGIGKSAEEGEAAAEPAIITAFRKIGERIQHLLEATLPEAFTNAWAVLSDIGNDIWTGFRSIFDDSVKPNGPVQTAIHDFANSIKKFIIEDIPKALDDAWKFITGTIGNLFNPKNTIPADMFDEQGQLIAEKYREFRLNLNKEMESQNEKPSDTGGIFQTLKDFFTSIFDSLFGGDGGDGAVGESLLDKLSDFFLHKVPKFLGKIVGDMFNSIPDIIGNFTEGFVSTAKAEGSAVEEEEKSAEQVASRVSNAFAGILETFMNQLESGAIVDTAKTLVALIAIIELLKVVRDILGTINVTGNLAEKASAKNGFEAAMKRMFTAMIAAFALIAYISSLPEDQRKDAIAVTKDLVELFKLLSILTTAGSIASDVSDTVSSFGNAAQAMSQTSSTKSIPGALNMILNALGIATTAEIVQYGAQDIIGSIVEVFKEISSGFQTVSTYVKQVVENLTEIKADMDTAISVASNIPLLFSWIASIGGFKSQLETIVEIMPSLSGALSMFKTSVTGKDLHAKEIVDALGQLVSMQVDLGVLAIKANSQSFQDIKYYLSSLGAALSMFSMEGVDASKTESSLSTAVKILKGVLSNGELIELGKSLDADQFPDSRSIYESSERVVMLSGAIASIAKAASVIPDDADENLQKLFASVSKIDVPDEDGGKSIDNISGQFATLGVALSSFANDTSGLTEEKMTNAQRAIEIATGLMTSLQGTGQGLLEKFFEGDESISKFGTGISNLGTNLNSFFTSVSDVQNYDEGKVQMAIRAVASFASSMAVINDKDTKDVFRIDFGSLANGLDRLGPSLSKFFDGVQSGKDAFKGIKNINIEEGQFASLKKMFDIIHTIAEVSALGEGQNANTELGELADQLKLDKENSFGRVVIDFFNAIGSLEIEQVSIDAFKAFGDAIKAIAEILAASNKQLSTGTPAGRTAEEKFKNLLTGMAGVFGEFNKEYDNMKQFFVNANSFDQNGIEIAKNVFKGLSDMAQAMFYIDNTDINKGLSNLKWFDWDLLSQVLSESFIGSVQNYQDNFKPLGSTIAQVIAKSAEEAISSEENAIHIKPIIDIDKDFIDQQLNDQLGIGGEYKLDMNALVKSISGVGESEETGLTSEYFDGKFTEIAQLFETLTNNTATVGDVSSALGGMTMVLDTGVLAGAMANDIDALIGNKVWLVLRGNSVYMGQ